MRRISIPRQWSDVTLESGCALDDGVVILCSGGARKGKVTIRSGTYVNRFTMFDASEMIDVGADAMIGPFCYITDHDHGQGPGQRICDRPLISAHVSIGANAWLGAGVTVLKGVVIGHDSVIGAGSVVTRCVEPFAKVAGIPARPIESTQKSAPVAE